MEIYRGPEKEFVVSPLDDGTVYSFRVCAGNDRGDSPWSETISVSTLGVYVKKVNSLQTLQTHNQVLPLPFCRTSRQGQRNPNPTGTLHQINQRQNRNRLLKKLPLKPSSLRRNLNKL